MKTGKDVGVKQLLTLYFVMGSLNCRKAPEMVLQEAIDGGISCFSFGKKGQGHFPGEQNGNLLAA